MSNQTSTNKRENLQGNHACALAAVAAGCRFYAGYPITPSSEIAERMSLELPKVDGVFVQMEDEIASMGAILGASMGGAKVMTATSGPGFSLKQENIGYGVMTEVPCVVVNVMRGGPSTGMPTRPAQGDIMQARWGTHGDHPIIVLTPASVNEIYQQTIRAFNLAERLSTPVVVLYDETIGHLVETVDVAGAQEIELHERKWAAGEADDYLPYQPDDDMVPPMTRPGDGYRTHTTGLTHGEDGFPTQDPDTANRVLSRLYGKLEHNKDIVECFEAMDTEDADILIVAYGITSHAARSAVHDARDKGIKVGLFRPITMWPFPEQALLAAASKARHIVVAEMNAGQLVLEIERLAGRDRVQGLNRYDGEHITPADILSTIEGIA
ncbi:MAG: 2-oxoacid:acceptor oxidoreductase subunit alpha [Magnetovibrio sp.]|nr:2-oxoacid:acceptor oxidoreductase subunit alpha [Magnetovibrio sp.]